MMVVSAAGAALNVGLNLWWIPAFGIEGAAWATVATEGFILGATAWRVAALTGLRFRLGRAWRPGLCALGAAALLWPMRDVPGSPAGRLLTGVLLGAAAVALSGVLPLRLEAGDGERA
jgi:O-antigen/teichoic acid export membrane protein